MLEPLAVACGWEFQGRRREEASQEMLELRHKLLNNGELVIGCKKIKRPQ